MLLYVQMCAVTAMSAVFSLGQQDSQQISAGRIIYLPQTTSTSSNVVKLRYTDVTAVTPLSLPDFSHRCLIFLFLSPCLSFSAHLVVQGHPNTKKKRMNPPRLGVDLLRM